MKMDIGQKGPGMPMISKHTSPIASGRSGLTPPALYTRRSALGLFAGAALVGLGACSKMGAKTGSMDEGASSDADSKPSVLTTFTVTRDIAANVAGDFLDVRSITKAGAEIHDYEPTPEDIKQAEGAALILNNGLGLERWFERFATDSHAERVDLSKGVDPISISEGDFAGEANPHAWMSPKNGQIYVDNMVAAFSRLDPDHASDYESNGKSYKESLEKISSELIQRLDELPTDQRTLVTCEGAFSYLCRDANLDEIYLWPVNSAEEGTPQQIAKVVQAVRDKSIPAVFCESTVSPKAMRQVADETGASLRADAEHMLYVDSLSDGDGPVPTYLELLSHDAKVIVEGLTGKESK